MLVAVLIGLITLGIALRPSTDVTRPATAHWFQIASYRRGTITHLTPMRDRQHTEDEHGSCCCNPRSSHIPLTEGRLGTLYIHRTIAGDTRRSTR